MGGTMQGGSEDGLNGAPDGVAEADTQGGAAAGERGGNARGKPPAGDENDETEGRRDGNSAPPAL